jgi:hypothetical protein
MSIRAYTLDDLALEFGRSRDWAAGDRCLSRWA